MKKLEFVVLGQPMGLKRARTGGGHFYDPKENKDYKSMVRDCVYRSGFNGSPHEGPVTIKAIFVSLRPKKYMRDDYPDGRFLSKAKPDVDNLLKMILDALNKYVFRDDSQVCYASIRKLYCAKEFDGPKSEIWITLDDD